MLPFKEQREEKKREEKVREGSDDGSYVDNPNGMYDNPDEVCDDMSSRLYGNESSSSDEDEVVYQDPETTDPDYGDVVDAHKSYQGKAVIELNTGLIINPLCLTPSKYVRFESKEGNVVEDLRARLRHDNVDPQKMDAFLLKHKGVIAGSYPLQCVLGKNWIGCDIDIWVQSDDEKASLIDQDMKEMGYRLSICRTMGGNRNRFKFVTQEISRTPSIGSSLASIYQRIRQKVLDGYYGIRGIDNSSGNYNIYRNAPMEEKYAKEIEEYMRLETHVKTVSIYRASDRPDIQVIITNCDTFAVVDSFDISVCRVAYSGEGIYVHPQTGLGLNQAFITPESAQLQTQVEWARTQKRMIKYSRRGFKIDPSELVKFIDKIHANCQYDMGKFISRWNREMITKIDKNVVLADRVKDTNIPIFHNYYIKPCYEVRSRNYWVFKNNIDANKDRIKREDEQKTPLEERFDPYITNLSHQIYKHFFRRRSIEIGPSMDSTQRKIQIFREWQDKRDPLSIFIKEHDNKQTVRVISDIKIVVAFGIIGQKPLRIYETSVANWNNMSRSHMYKSVVQSVCHGGARVLRLLRVREKFLRGRFLQTFSANTNLSRSGPDVNSLVGKFVGPVPQWIDILLEYPEYYESLRTLTTTQVL